MPQLLLSVVGMLAGAEAFSQDAAGRGPAARRFETTAFAGYRMGGTFDVQDSDASADVGDRFAYALALDYRIDATQAYELFYSRQPTRVSLGPASADLDVQYLMFGGTLTIEETSHLQPYIVGLIGVGQLSPDAPDADDESRFAISLGLGLRVPVRERIDIRLEARGYLTFLDTDTSVFCRTGATDNTCLLRGSGSSFVQGEVLAGVAVSF